MGVVDSKKVQEGGFVTTKLPQYAIVHTLLETLHMEVYNGGCGWLTELDIGRG